MKSSYWLKDIRTHLKNVFWPNIFVGASFQILDNQQVACGLKLGPAAILNQNPIFEMGSRNIIKEVLLSTKKFNLCGILRVFAIYPYHRQLGLPSLPETNV
jgi:hypothetical protein